MTRPSHRILLALSAAALATAQPARAALGETTDSAAPQEHPVAVTQRWTSGGGHYSIRESVSDSTTVREYLSARGVVFALAWDGLTHPDLSRLLGSYAAEYHDAMQAAPPTPGRRCHEVKTDRLVVEKWGHMRHLQGRAYATLLVPAGVSVDEIK